MMISSMFVPTMCGEWKAQKVSTFQFSPPTLNKMFNYASKSQIKQ
jgi:hypothetical protein